MPTRKEAIESAKRREIEDLLSFARGLERQARETCCDLACFTARALVLSMNFEEAKRPEAAPALDLAKAMARAHGEIMYAEQRLRLTSEEIKAAIDKG